MIPKSVAEIVRERVVLEVEGIDRMYLNGYVPGLQTEGGLVKFIRTHLGLPIASTAAVAPMTHEFVRKIEQFAKDLGVNIVSFEKGQRKDDVMKEHLARFDRTEGVLFIGKAQEKARVFRTVQKKHPESGRRYPWITRGSAVPNHFYFYVVDEDFGPLFIKFCSYFPYAMKVCLNGHEWVKRQLAKEGIAFQPLDNGILSCEAPQRLQALCDCLDEGKIVALVSKWLERLPHPFRPQDQAAGYGYALSILQAEFSLTQVFDRPQTGRQFFEEIIRENLDLGRPDRVQLIFGRRVTRRTPSSFRTRVLTEGVIPSLHVEYKRSKIKQYHKEGRALRTETTINNTYDFAIGRGLKNLPALRRIGFTANRRLLDVQTLSHDCTIGEEHFQSVIRPTVCEGQRASALAFGDPRVLALMHALCLFVLLPTGFVNRDLCHQVCQLLGLDPAHYHPGKMTYDLRRLRLHGLIRKRPRSNRYEVTAEGLRTALFLTRAYARFFRVAFAHQTGGSLPLTAPSAPKRAFQKAASAVDQFIEEVRLAA
jgi:hypothetical protein